MRELCKWKGVNIIEAEVCVDHIHMLLEIPPKMSISSFMGFLKGKKQFDDIRKMGESEIQVSESGSFGAEDTMWTRQGKTQRRYRNTYRSN